MRATIAKILVARFGAQDSNAPLIPRPSNAQGNGMRSDGTGDPNPRAIAFPGIDFTNSFIYMPKHLYETNGSY